MYINSGGLLYLLMPMRFVGSLRQNLPETHVATSRAIHVKLLLTRHALSCANAVRTYGSTFFYQQQRFAIYDPMLTTCGETQSKVASAANVGQGNIDMVLSSSMLRAMQTAALQYPGYKITPVPYISEEGLTHDNKPLSLENQESKITEANISDVPWDRFDMKWMKHQVFGDTPRRKPSWSDFEKFIAYDLLPSLPKELKAKESLTIAVVSHSHFLNSIPHVQQYCAGKSFYNEKPRNNQVLELDFVFNTFLVIYDLTSGGTVAEAAIDAYTEAGKQAWDQVRAVLENGSGEGAIALDGLLPNGLPPWDDSGIEFVLRRSFDVAPGAKCRNRYPGEDPPEFLCGQDVGNECEKAFKSIMFYPRMTLKEQHSKDIAKKARRIENNEDYAALTAELQHVKNYPCCGVVCKCSSAGRLKGKRGDWCWLTEDHSGTRCYLMGGKVAPHWRWAYCEENGTMQIACPQAKATCATTPFDCSAETISTVNRGSGVSCSGNASTCDANTCCEAPTATTSNPTTSSPTATQTPVSTSNLITDGGTTVAVMDTTARGGDIERNPSVSTSRIATTPTTNVIKSSPSTTVAVRAADSDDSDESDDSDDSDDSTDDSDDTAASTTATWAPNSTSTASVSPTSSAAPTTSTITSTPTATATLFVSTTLTTPVVAAMHGASRRSFGGQLTAAVFIMLSATFIH